MGVSHPQLLLQLASLICIYGHSEELRGSQGRVTGDHVTRVVGFLHSVLLLRCVDHPHLKLSDHLPQKNMSYKIVRPYEISVVSVDLIQMYYHKWCGSGCSGDEDHVKYMNSNTEDRGIQTSYLNSSVFVR